jgi:cardiolipin synthase A/B
MCGQLEDARRKRRNHAIFAVLLFIASGCATIPNARNDIAEAAAVSPPGPTIVGPNGALTSAQSSRLLSKAAGDADQALLLQRHLQLEQAIAGEPLTAGNATELLRNGDGTFAAVFQAIEGARNHVNLEYYTLEDVEFEGRRLSDVLIAKHREGVAINIIYDSFGSSSTPAEFFKRLEQAGVKLLDFRPVNPLEAAAGGYSPNDRNHRKITIADGRIAIMGGVNLATYYQSKTLGSSKPEEAGPTNDRLPDDWRDLSIRIEGPAVAQLQRLFLGHWKSQHGPELDESGFFPNQQAADDEVVRIIGSSPQQDTSRYYVTVISAFRHAERRIWLTTAYFVPTTEEKEELIKAARRGVDVRLILPAVSDAPQAIAVARSHYSDLLEAGVRIFELDHVILHSKAMTIDGVWTAIGSSNFDHRSVLYNDEVDAVVLGTKMAGELERVFNEDQAAAKEIRLEEWKNRPLADRLSDFLQRTLQYVL